MASIESSRRQSLWLVPWFALALACGGGTEEGSEDVAETDAAGTTGTADGDADADGTDGFVMEGCVGACGTENCGECPDAAMVAGDGYMIDAAEVSNGQYAKLLEVEFGAAVLPAGCEWKQGFLPEDWSDSLDADLPVVGVDWCDAAVFCAWAGKELCGAVGGGPSDYEQNADMVGDAWYRACSTDGTLMYPYGNEFDPQACNGSELLVDDTVPTGSIPTCVGGLPGLFDMSGNVWEWTNACESASGDEATKCRRRGGSYFSEVDSLRCSISSERERSKRDNAIGFRCCG